MYEFIIDKSAVKCPECRMLGEQCNGCKQKYQDYLNSDPRDEPGYYDEVLSPYEKKYWRE